jgi:drug/metabolite transporter (DMT)-like permease
VAAVLALVSAALYGAADFLGGLAARRAPVIPVVTLAQGTGVVLLLAMVPLLPPTSPSIADLSWGAAAGLAGGAGVAWLYRALAVGTMAIVAPVTAVAAVAIPVAVGLLLGERPGVLTLIGIITALLSIVLVSQQPAEGGTEGASAGTSALRVPRGVGIALLSGVAIGLFYLCLARTEPDAGLWPLVAARVASTSVFAVGTVGTGASLRLSSRALNLAIVGGALDVAANALYLLAARRGALAVVVTLVSLYPASTVVLAKVFLGERFSRVQAAGIVCALGAVLLIVSSS